MNIKIDKEMQEALSTCVLDSDTIEFGSLNGQDTDLLHIVYPNPQMDSCIHNRDHFLFYKCEETNTDHLYITPRGAVNALITGSSTLIYEILVEGKFKDTSLDFLHEMNIKSFHTYKLVKALLGVAERDLKQSLSHKEPEKKLLWVKNYYTLALEVLERQGITIIKAPRLGCQGVRLLDIKYARNKALELSKTVRLDVFNYLQDNLNSLGQANRNNLRKIAKFYFNNWKESL